MRSPPRVALGSGLYVAGLAGTVALSMGLGLDGAAAVAAVACCVGLAGAGAASTSERGARLLGHRVAAFTTGGTLVGLVVWATWAGLRTGGGVRYQLTIGSAFVAVVGWGVFAGGRRSGHEETVRATLPRFDPRDTAADDRPRWRSVARNVIPLVVVGYFAWRALTRGELYSGILAGIVFAAVLPGMHYRVELTDGGLVATRYVAWVVPVRRQVTPWTAIYGYEVTDDRLRIATDYGRDIVYERNRIADRDRVVGILDDHLPRL